MSTASRISTVISIQLSATMTVCRTSFCCGTESALETAIEAMNRAIEDEERSQGSVHGFLVYWRYVSVAQVYVKDSCLHQVFVQ